MTELLHLQQSQHILSCAAVVIPDNAFKYLLQCYLADDNEIADKCTREKKDGNILYLLTGKPSSTETGERHWEHLEEGKCSSAVNWALGRRDRSSSEVQQRVTFATMCHHCTQGMQRHELQEAPVFRNLSAATSYCRAKQ